MNTIRKVVVALATALPITMALPAFAHSGQGGGPGQHGATVEQRLADLKAKLQITGGQETEWRAFEAQVMGGMANASAARQNPPQPPTAAPDRLARRAEIMKQRSAGLEAVAGALKNLYVILSTEQQAIIDQHYARLERRGHRRHRRMQRS